MATIKQKIAMEKTLENIGNMKLEPMGKIMLEVGYKKSVAKNPKILTESKGWQELLNEHFPDERIQGLLNKALSEYEVEKEISDKRSFLGLIDMILKLKDKYPAGKFKIGAYEERDKVLE